MDLSRDEIRLECLRLAVTRSPDHNEALLRAERYFEFVIKPEDPQSKPEIVEKKAGNIRALT